MNTERLLTLYRHMLAPAGWVADEEGYISIKDEDGTSPCLIGKNELRAVLPTQHMLDKRDQSKLVYFHVLDESVKQSESEIFKTWRHAIMGQLQTAALATIYSLMVLAGSVKKHSKLTPKQSDVLALMPDLDDSDKSKRTYEDWEKLIAAIDQEPKERAVVSIFMKSGGKVKDLTCNRVAVTSFPFYQQLVADGQERLTKLEERKHLDKEKRAEMKVKNETFGIELRVHDREMFIRLFEWIWPSLNDAEKHCEYWGYSNANCGQSADALLMALRHLANGLNNVIELMESALPNLKDLKIPTEWSAEFLDINDMTREVQKVIVGRQDDRKVEARDERDTRREERNDREPARSGDREPGKAVSIMDLNLPGSRNRDRDRDDRRDYYDRDRRDSRRDYDDRRDYRSSERPRRDGGAISATEAMAGIKDNFYHNDRSTPFESRDRDYRRGGGRRYR